MWTSDVDVVLGSTDLSVAPYSPCQCRRAARLLIATRCPQEASRPMSTSCDKCSSRFRASRGPDGRHPRGEAGGPCNTTPLLFNYSDSQLRHDRQLSKFGLFTPGIVRCKSLPAHPDIITTPQFTTSTSATMSKPTLQTPLTKLLGIEYPIILAGMARTSGGPLAAAVSNAGGLGVIGGLGYTPEQLQSIIDELKANLRDKNLPFGVDLALPQVGGSARKTNHDYTHGQLDELIEVTIKNGAKLFVSAVGVPPARTIKRLHEAGILVMNMVGAPKHAIKALEAGVDIVCAQGGEGGGHTGDIANSILIPACVDVARKYKSPLTGQPAMVVAAGGIYNGRSLASSLMQGAQGVWVGTRFVASIEAGCSQMHKENVVSATFTDTGRTLVISGRPLRVKYNDYIKEWESRPEDIKKLTDAGIVPLAKDMDDGKDVDIPFLMGQVAGVVQDIKPAKEIVDEMVAEAVDMLKLGQTYIAGPSSKL
ncbi:NPD-domain-containing protein [Sporormia fimetaria CBS 119925]|uniref:NPD-domain-containing protein n=1 Tax=Sporormia fimetaria CBS 119925 TaxID=1340428 RepID=A0A6A6VIK9_9PLEO|nr:NPD-domain-containing protein [Sporormia fimetaria CBS 119925]